MVKHAILVCPYCEHRWIHNYTIISVFINWGNRSTLCPKCRKRCFVNLMAADKLTDDDLERMGITHGKRVPPKD